MKKIRLHSAAQKHSHSLAQDYGFHLISIFTAFIVTKIKSQTYPHTFHKTENVLHTFAYV